jgi:hypothetical protein
LVVYITTEVNAMRCQRGFTLFGNKYEEERKKVSLLTFKFHASNARYYVDIDTIDLGIKMGNGCQRTITR